MQLVSETPLCIHCEKRYVAVEEYTIDDKDAGLWNGLHKRRVFKLCPQCRDKLNTERIERGQGRKIQRRLRETAKVVPWFMQHDMDKLPKALIKQICPHILDVSGSKPTLKGGVYVYGKTGVGKTRALSYLCEGAVRAGATLKWYGFSSLLSANVGAIMNDDWKARGEFKRALESTDVLVVDDFGGEKAKLTQAGLEFVFWLFDGAYTSGRRLWISSNYPPEKAIMSCLDRGLRYNPEPLVRRMVTSMEVVKA